MKKRILSVLIVLAVICALFIIPADAKANVKSVWFEGEHVKLRAGANVDLLCDNKILSDENAQAKDFNKEGIVLVQNTNMMDAENNTIATMYFELDTLQNIDSVYITWYVYHQAIIGLPHNNNLIIGYSEDGETYIEIGAYDFEGETDPDTSFQLETTIRLGQTVKAKYVSVSFEYGPNNQDGWYCPMWEWVGFTEVGAGLMVDEVLGGGYDEVSEDNTPLDQIEPIVEIPEGYVALKHAKFNTSITTGSYTIITDPAAMQSYNVKWTACALLRPTKVEGEFSVVEVKWLNGDEAFVFADAAEGDIVLSVHGDDAADGTKANREALAALSAGNIVTFAGYNFEELSFERGAVVYFKNYNASIGDTSETPDDTSSDNVSDEVSETPDESSESEDESAPADESVPADESTPVVDNSEAGEEDVGYTGLIIGIVAGVVVIAAVAVVVVIVVKKKK
ncbi:MAG: hypothetical protein IKT37_05125 [Clostridia bacterium]|nr:hypothetical protein [Clostridia bacterium]